MLRRNLFLVVFTVAVIQIVGLSLVAKADAKSDAKAVLQQSGVSAGFFVHLDSEGGELTEALRQQ